MEMLAVPILLGGLAAFVVVAVLLGHWLLGPVNRAAGHLNAPTRFMLTDFIWLMIQLQIVLAAALQQMREAVSGPGLFVILGLLCLPVLVLWAASVSVVSRAGITRPLRRATVILVLVPGALAAMMAVPLLVVAAMVAMAPYPVRATSGWTQDAPTRAATLIGSAVLLVLSAFLLRWLSSWVLALTAAPTTPSAASHSPLP
jgi:hypothetical protein